jgi:catecholate siderophore receptor
MIIIIIRALILLKGDIFVMKKFIYIIAMVVSTSAIFAQDEQLEVKGNVLFKDQVNSLTPPVAIIDVPQALQIITDEDILNQGFRELGDIVRYVPGIIQTQGEGHRDAVVIRGQRTTADFYQDGMRDDVQYFRSLYNVEQVEVLKGANALMFGRGGIGGLINRVSKKAILGETFTNMNVGADSFGAGDFAVDGNLQINDSVAFRLNAHSDSLANHRDQYDGERFGINPTMTIAVDDATTIDLSYEYADHERFVDRGIPTDDATKSPIDAMTDIVFGTKDLNKTTLEANILKGSLNHNYSDTGKLNFSVSANDFRKVYQNLYVSDYTSSMGAKMDGYRDVTMRESLIIALSNINEFDRGTLTVGFEMVDTENNNHRYNTYFSSTRDDNEIFVPVRNMNFNVANGNLTNRRTLETGGLTDADVTQDQVTYVDYISDLNNQSDTDIEVTSLYLQGNIDLADQWKMILGGRYDEVETTIKQYGITVDGTGKGALNGTNPSLTKKDSLFSPRLGLIFKPQENMSLYFSYSESFQPRSGEQYKTFVDKAKTTVSSKYNPDVFENTELGFKYDMDSGLSLALAYFMGEQTKATAFDNGTGEETREIGLEIDGFEITLNGQINDNNALRFGLASVDATKSKGSGAAKEIPELTYSLWYTHQANDMFAISLGATYQDESYINAESGPLLPDYTRFDMAMTITPTENDVVRINIENLGDETYYPHSHSDHQVSVGESQNVRVSYSKRF